MANRKSLKKICMSHPSDFLLPRGWVEMYMLQMPHLFVPKEGAPPSKPKLEYRKALLALIRSFCHLIQRIESDQLFNHKFSGKSRLWEFLVRRNVDFLAICILNAFSWRPTQSLQAPLDRSLNIEYAQVLTLVQKVLKSPAFYSASRSNIKLIIYSSQTFNTSFADAPNFRECTSEYVLARKFIRSFNDYAGKDIPLVVQATRNTVPFFSFLGWDVSTVLLASLQPPAAPQMKTTPNGIIESVDSEPGEHTQKEVTAASVIQRMWRTRYPIVQRRRDFFKSPSGQAISYIQRICKHVLGEEYLGQKERMWRTGILFSKGLEVYQQAKSIEKQYLKAREIVMLRIDTADTSQMEDFQDQWERVSRIRDDVRKNVGFLSEKNWKQLNIPGRELSRKCNETLRILHEIEAALKDITD